LINHEAALAVIPEMLAPDAKTRRKAFELIRQVLDTEDAARLARVARFFGVDEGKTEGLSGVRHHQSGCSPARRPTASRASY